LHSTLTPGTPGALSLAHSTLSSSRHALIRLVVNMPGTHSLVQRTLADAGALVIHALAKVDLARICCSCFRSCAARTPAHWAAHTQHVSPARLPSTAPTRCRCATRLEGYLDILDGLESVIHELRTASRCPSQPLVTPRARSSALLTVVHGLKPRTRAAFAVTACFASETRISEFVVFKLM